MIYIANVIPNKIRAGFFLVEMEKLIVKFYAEKQPRIEKKKSKEQSWRACNISFYNLL